LGLLLNYAIFNAEVLKNVTEAIKISEKAVNESTDKVEEMQDDEFKEAKDIIELLKENLNNWRQIIMA
jgi:hypothetical protein